MDCPLVELKMKVKEAKIAPPLSLDVLIASLAKQTERTTTKSLLSVCFVYFPQKYMKNQKFPQNLIVQATVFSVVLLILLEL